MHKNPVERRAYMRRYYQQNLEVMRAKGRKRAQKRNNRVRRLAYNLQTKYGLTKEQWSAILSRQDNRCGICGSDSPKTKKGWQTDADHSVSPARVRGILCQPCNLALGKFRHSRALLVSASEWLK